MAASSSKAFSRLPRICRSAGRRGPIIVVLTVGGEEHSTLPAHHVLEELQKSGAALNVIAINSPATPRHGHSLQAERAARART